MTRRQAILHGALSAGPFWSLASRQPPVRLSCPYASLAWLAADPPHPERYMSRYRMRMQEREPVMFIGVVLPIGLSVGPWQSWRPRNALRIRLAELRHRRRRPLAHGWKLSHPTTGGRS